MRDGPHAQARPHAQGPSPCGMVHTRTPVPTHDARGFAREFRRSMSLSSGGTEISSPSMFAGSRATVRVDRPCLSPKKNPLTPGDELQKRGCVVGDK